MSQISDLTDSVEYIDAEIVRLRDVSVERELTVDESASFEAGLAEREALVARIDLFRRMTDIVANKPEHVESGDGAGFTPPNVIVRTNPFDLSELRLDAPTGEIRSKARAAIEQSTGLTDAHRERAEEVLRQADTLDGAVSKHIVATGNPLYRSAFLKMLSGDFGLVTSDEQKAVQAVRAAGLTAGNGGNAVPYVLDLSIIDTKSHSTNPFRQISRVVASAANVWHGVSSAGVTASWDAEAAEVSDDAPTLSAPAITCYKGAAFVPFSVEIGGDWASIEADLRAEMGRAKDDLEGAAFATGSGSAQPYGIVTALAGGAQAVAPTVAESVTIADTYKLENALDARYRARASWVANKSIYNIIRAADTYGGGSMWERIGAAQPAQLLGYPAYESSDMDGAYDAAATATNYLAVLGDFSNYVIVDRVGMSVELVPHLLHTSNNRPSGQRGFYAWWRTGADSVNDAAFVLLSVPTTA